MVASGYTERRRNILKINYYTVKSNLDKTRGYGNAGFQLVTTLQSLGHRVQYDEPSSPVSLNFCMPTAYKFYDNQYRIGYTPWESTSLAPGFLDAFNSCDEVWATSQWVADVYKKCGVKPPVKVFHHGLDSRWQPVKRSVDGVIKFLHIGEPALRKGGQLAVDAFRDAFGDRTDVHLTIKAMDTHYLACWNGGNVQQLRDQYNNVTIITESLNEQALRALYADHHVMVYPSYGEGFGLIPLQALGTGMPTICTDDWAPYREHLRELKLYGSYARSPWVFHPGNVYHPDYDMLVGLYRLAAYHIEPLLDDFYKNAPNVHHDFNWQTLTENAFKDLTENNF